MLFSGESSNLFTGALYNQYQPPPGFCFDILCADEPIIDAKHSPDNNINKRVSFFEPFLLHATLNPLHSSWTISLLL